MRSTIPAANHRYPLMVAAQGTGQYWKQDFLLLADALSKPDTTQTWLDTFHADATAAGQGLGTTATVSLLRKNGDRTRVMAPSPLAAQSWWTWVSRVHKARPLAMTPRSTSLRNNSARPMRIGSATGFRAGISAI